MAALFALLSNHGILPEAIAAIPNIGAGSSSLPRAKASSAAATLPIPHRRAHKRLCSGSKAVVCLPAKSVVVRGGCSEGVESRGSPERAALWSRAGHCPAVG